MANKYGSDPSKEDEGQKKKEYPDRAELDALIRQRQEERLEQKLAKGYRPNAQRAMTDERKQKFLTHLSEYGVVSAAARHASLHSNRGALRSFYLEREKDPEFALAWEDALAEAAGVAEEELHRRAVEGYDEPVFYKGEEVGVVRKYSDALLLAKVRAGNPAYHQHQKLTHEGGIEVKPLNLGTLAPESRDALRSIITTEQQRRLVVEPAVAHLSAPEDDSEGHSDAEQQDEN